MLYNKYYGLIPIMKMQTSRRTSLGSEYFQDRFNEAQAFADQNTRYEQLQNDPTFEEVDAIEFKTIAANGLYLEQSNTRNHLLAQDNEPYELLVKTYEDLLAEIKVAKADLEIITDQEDIRKSHLLDIVRRVVEIAPLAETTANTLASKKIEAIENIARNVLQQRIGSLTVEIAELEQVLAIAGKAWEIPRVIQAYDISLQQDIDNEKIIIEDVIPLEQETHETEGAMKKLIERHGTTHGASLTLVAILMDNQNRIFLPQELGEVLYQDESHFEGMSEAIKTMCINQRIHRLLNQHSSVKPILEKEGYVLQYGYRHFIDYNTRRPLQRKRRIYRVVSQNDAQDVPTTFEDIVDPNRADVIIPMVIKRTGLPYKKAQEVKVSKALENDNSAERELQTKIKKIIAEFWDKGLLPDDMEKKWTVQFLRTKIYGLRIPRSKIIGKEAPLRNLYTKAERNETANSTDATDIIFAGLPRALQKRSELSKKEENRIITLIESELQEFYDNLEM